MNIVAPDFIIEDDIVGENILKNIEKYGRVCYKSEDNITYESAKIFVKKILDMGHESVIEHEKISIRLICDRGISHELVRHRIASYSQESTRYCNYGKDKFGNSISVIKPNFWGESDSEKLKVWEDAMASSEKAYLKLLNLGATPQEARSVLPNSLKTEVIVTMNLREWRHFFKLRTSSKAHPQMIELARPLLAKFQELVPVVFDDINY